MYQIIVNHPLYRDTPPMPAMTQKDVQEVISDLLANGVRKAQIVVTGGK